MYRPKPATRTAKLLAGGSKRRPPSATTSKVLAPHDLNKPAKSVTPKCTIAKLKQENEARLLTLKTKAALTIQRWFRQVRSRRLQKEIAVSPPSFIRSFKI